MLRWNSAQGVQDDPDGEERTEQFETLGDTLWDDYYCQEDIESQKRSELERSNRKIVLRMIRFFLNEL